VHPEIGPSAPLFQAHITRTVFSAAAEPSVKNFFSMTALSSVFTCFDISPYDARERQHSCGWNLLVPMVRCELVACSRIPRALESS